MPALVVDVGWFEGVEWSESPERCHCEVGCGAKDEKRDVGGSEEGLRQMEVIWESC
jgi:hypothetical protein